MKGWEGGGRATCEMAFENVNLVPKVEAQEHILGAVQPCQRLPIACHTKLHAALTAQDRQDATLLTEA